MYPYLVLLITQDTPKCLLLGNDGDLIVVGTDIGCVQIFSLSQKKLLSTLDWDQPGLFDFPYNFQEALTCLSIDENDRYIAAGSIHGTVIIFDLQTNSKHKKTCNKSGNGTLLVPSDW